MSSSKLVIQGAAGAAGAEAGPDIAEVFKINVWDGDSTASRGFVNGVDLSTEGGLVWWKSRSNPSTGTYHHFADSARGSTGGFLKTIYGNTNEAENTYAPATYGGISSFNTNGFTFAKGSNTNYFGNLTGHQYVGYTFRQADNFFKVLTYTGTGAAKTLTHNLGCDVGMVLIKKTSSAKDWYVWHRSLASSQYLVLNEADAADTASTIWGSAPTSTNFYLGSGNANDYGADYVAYFFGHNDSDAGFGPTSEDDVIKCGEFTETSGSDTKITLGFEPQFFLIKNKASGGWGLYDNMRGLNNKTSRSLGVNSSGGGADQANRFEMHADGITWKDTSNSRNLIYMAIRRGPLNEPEHGDQVINIINETSDASNKINGSLGPVDMTIQTQDSTPISGYHWVLATRLQGGYNIASGSDGSQFMQTSDTGAEGSSTLYFDNDGGIEHGAWFSSGALIHNYVRRRGVFDLVFYKGNSTADRAVKHGLGKTPEMMWIKARDGARAWRVFHKSFTNGSVRLNSSAAKDTGTNYFGTPTDDTFILGTDNDTNSSSYNYLACLFATVDGVSKVGSYTGNGGSQTIDCGFTNGARMVMIKASSATGSWRVYDTTRGIVSGNDPMYTFDDVANEVTSTDTIDPHSSGFIVGGNDTNQSGVTYIFFAIGAE